MLLYFASWESHRPLGRRRDGVEVAIKIMRAEDEEELHGRRQEFEILKRFLGLKRQHQNARRVRKLRLSRVLRVRFLSQHQGFSAFSASSMHCFFPVFLSLEFLGRAVVCVTVSRKE